MSKTLPSIETTSACRRETFGFSNTISQIVDSRPMRIPEPPRPRRSPAREPLRIVNRPRSRGMRRSPDSDRRRQLDTGQIPVAAGGRTERLLPVAIEFAIDVVRDARVAQKLLRDVDRN